MVLVDIKTGFEPSKLECLMQKILLTVDPSSATNERQPIPTIEPGIGQGPIYVRKIFLFKPKRKKDEKESFLWPHIGTMTYTRFLTNYLDQENIDSLQHLSQKKPRMESLNYKVPINEVNSSENGMMDLLRIQGTLTVTGCEARKARKYLDISRRMSPDVVLSATILEDPLTLRTWMNRFKEYVINDYNSRR